MTRIVILFLILSKLSTFGQIQMYNSSLRDSTKKLLYIGVDNKINLSGIKDRKNIKLISTSGKCTMDKLVENIFNIQPTTEVGDTLRVLVDDSIALMEIYEIKRVGDPIAILANTQDIYLTKDQIKSFPFLSVVIPECYHKIDFRIISYDVYFVLYDNQVPPFNARKFKNRKMGEYKTKFKRADNNCTIGSVVQYIGEVGQYDPDTQELLNTKKIKMNQTEIYDNNLNQMHLEMVEQMQTGDKIVFEKIKIILVGGDCSSRALRPLTVIIK